MSQDTNVKASGNAVPLRAQEAGWSDYWRKEGVGGEVFVTPENQRHEQLGGFWREVLGALGPGTRVLDIACGAGSVFASLPANHGLELHGSDVSPQALKLLKARIKGVKGTLSSAAELSYDDRSFGAVVSQFGVEYAGLEAFTEAGRVIAPEGRFVFLCHCEGGYVDVRTASQLAGAQAARSSQFAFKAAQLVRAMFALEPTAVKRLAVEFQKSEVVLRKCIARHPEGIHAHLYHGFRQIYADYRNYALPDILKWLADVSAEVDMAAARLSQMHKAMLSETAMREALSRLTAAGLKVEKPVALKLDGHDAPLAWHLAGHRPGF